MEGNSGRCIFGLSLGFLAIGRTFRAEDELLGYGFTTSHGFWWGLGVSLFVNKGRDGDMGGRFKDFGFTSIFAFSFLEWTGKWYGDGPSR
jgi:hypothetical protein